MVPAAPLASLCCRYVGGVVNDETNKEEHVTQINDVTNGQLFVDLTFRDGAYTIAGQHLSGSPFGNEYSYKFAIPASATSQFATSLGTDAEGIPAAWAAQVQQIASRGEREWLMSHGVLFSFHSY